MLGFTLSWHSFSVQLLSPFHALAILSLALNLAAAFSPPRPRACTSLRSSSWAGTAGKHFRSPSSVQLDTEDEVEELRAELEALRTLYVQDVEALQADVAELEKKQNTGLAPVDDAADPDATARIEALSEQVTQLIEELSAERKRAYRAESEAEDLRAELDAVRTLAEESEQATRAELGEMAEKLKQAESAAAVRTPAEDVGTEADQQKIAMLTDQVEELLLTLQGQEIAATELMQLRPRVAALEKELADERKKASGESNIS